MYARVHWILCPSIVFKSSRLVITKQVENLGKPGTTCVHLGDSSPCAGHPFRWGDVLPRAATWPQGRLPRRDATLACKETVSKFFIPGLPGTSGVISNVLCVLTSVCSNSKRPLGSNPGPSSPLELVVAACCGAVQIGEGSRGPAEGLQQRTVLVKIKLRRVVLPKWWSVQQPCAGQVA